MMKGQSLPVLEHIAPAVPALIRVMQKTERDIVINDISWGFSFLTQAATDDVLRLVINCGGVPRLI